MEVESELEGVEAGLPEEQEVDVAAAAHGEGELRQTLELPLRHQHPLDPNLTATSESGEVEAALPKELILEEEGSKQVAVKVPEEEGAKQVAVETPEEQAGGRHGSRPY